MNTPRRAIHIRAGEARAGQAVDNWLEHHGVERVCCADVLDACAFILKNSAHVPDLAYVGVDRLTADDLAIIKYLRETWPAIAIVLYGEHAELNSSTRATRTLVCQSRAALDQILAAPPNHLLAKFWRISSPIEPDTEADDGFIGRNERPTATPRTSDDSDPADAKGPAAMSEPLEARRGDHASRSHPSPPSPSPRSTLTPEELAILLEDTHD
ncbi:MAG TPA: hypothetical protein VM487_04490 [Phycisphaerae bacterium]|nr:hypothetical protein [Phycisphaerae bacterium]